MTSQSTSSSSAPDTTAWSRPHTSPAPEKKCWCSSAAQCPAGSWSARRSPRISPSMPVLHGGPAAPAISRANWACRHGPRAAARRVSPRCCRTARAATRHPRRPAPIRSACCRSGTPHAGPSSSAFMNGGRIPRRRLPHADAAPARSRSCARDGLPLALLGLQAATARCQGYVPGDPRLPMSALELTEEWFESADTEGRDRLARHPWRHAGTRCPQVPVSR